jgi:hypothetical protein
VHVESRSVPRRVAVDDVFEPFLTACASAQRHDLYSIKGKGTIRRSS